MSAKLAVVIHAEEEFDWNGGFCRFNDSVTHHQELIVLIREMLKIGAKVTLAMDYPFVTSAGGQQVINTFRDQAGEAIEFAAHLHPWVNPPYLETGEDGVASELESYPGNLSAELEFEKIQVLSHAIKRETGLSPVTYLAGRYGIGPNTRRILQRLGYRVDLSISAFSNFTHQQGPDFSTFNNRMFQQDQITYLPHTCSRMSAFPWASKTLNDHPLLLTGQDFTTRVVRKMLGVRTYRLSPEGVPLKDLIAAARHQLKLGHHQLVLSFHSPTVKPGMTPYVSSADEYQTFRATTLDFIEWFNRLPDSEMFLPASLAHHGGCYA